MAKIDIDITQFEEYQVIEREVQELHSELVNLRATNTKLANELQRNRAKVGALLTENEKLSKAILESKTLLDAVKTLRESYEQESKELSMKIEEKKKESK